MIWIKMLIACGIILSATFYTFHLKAEMDAHKTLKESVRAAAVKNWETMKTTCSLQDLTIDIHKFCDQLRTNLVHQNDTEMWWSSYHDVIRSEYQDHLQDMVIGVTGFVQLTYDLVCSFLRAVISILAAGETVSKEGARYAGIFVPLLFVLLFWTVVLFLCYSTCRLRFAHQEHKDKLDAQRLVNTVDQLGQALTSSWTDPRLTSNVHTQQKQLPSVYTQQKQLPSPTYTTTSPKRRRSPSMLQTV